MRKTSNTKIFKTEYRMMAGFMAALMLSETFFTVGADISVWAAENVECETFDTDIVDSFVEDFDDIDTETVEVSGLDDEAMPFEESISENMEADTDAASEEIMAGTESSGRLYEDLYQQTDYYNEWNKYARLKYGDKVRAVTGIDYFKDNRNNEEYFYDAYKDMSLYGGYDRENHCWYGVVRIPEYDTHTDWWFGEAPMTPEEAGCSIVDGTYSKGSAIVRIDGVDKVENNTEYEATYLYDCNLYFNRDRFNSIHTVQYKDGRIYTLATWGYESFNDLASAAGQDALHHKDDSYIYRNGCTIYLLYSTDTEGKDLKLHYRFADVSYDKTMRTPWYMAFYGGSGENVENGTKYYYSYQGLVWYDNKWQGAFEKFIPGVNPERNNGVAIPAKYVCTVYKPLPEGVISDEDIGGFLSPSDYWFDKRNSLWEKDWNFRLGQITSLDEKCNEYLMTWLYESGFKASIYPNRIPATARDMFIYDGIWSTEYPEEFGVNKEYEYYKDYTDENISYAYPDGVHKGIEKEEPAQDKKDDELTADDIPAPIRVEYPNGPIVVKNKLNIKALLGDGYSAKMKYKVDNKRLAKVNSKGIMTAKKPGNVVVTGYARVRSGSDSKKWVWKEIGSVKLEIVKPEFKELENNTLKLKVGDGNVDLKDYIINDSMVSPKMSIDKAEVAKINGKGILKPVGEGTAKVTVRFGDYKMKLKVIITP